MTTLLIAALTLGTLTACGARRDTTQSAPAVQGTAPSSEMLSAQVEQQLDELIATLEAEDTPEELQGFVP